MTLVVASLVVAGCSSEPNEAGVNDPNEIVGTSDSLTYEITLSCRSGGATGPSLPLYGCFVAGSTGVGGDLNIESGNMTRQYTELELATLSDTNESFQLKSPFVFRAQANGDANMLLIADVTQDGEIIGQDQASAFGTIYLSDYGLAHN